MITYTKETLSKLTPQLAVDILKEGNQRFVNNRKADRDLLQQVHETASGQAPFAVILSCMDSRTSAELVFDQGFGDIFSIRVAGNVLNQDVLGSMEYACKAVGSKLVVVLGHTKCGAIVGACNDVELGNLTSLLSKIKPAIEAETQTTSDRTGNNPEFVQHVTENNVNLTIAKVREESPILAELESTGEVMIIGGLYDVATGQVSFFSEPEKANS